MRPTLPNPPPPRALPSAFPAPTARPRHRARLLRLSLGALGVLWLGTQNRVDIPRMLRAAASTVTPPPNGTERTSIHAAQLDDGRIYVTEATVPNLQAAYHHWVFDPASQIATPIDVPASFRNCLAIGLDGHTLIGFHPETKPPRYCALDLDERSIIWLAPSYRLSVGTFPKPAEYRTTDVDLEDLVRPWLPDATLFAAHPLRTSEGTPIEVEGRGLVALHLGRPTHRAPLGLHLDERYMIALPQADGSGPAWQIEGHIRGHSTLAFDGVFRVGPHEVLLLIGALARTIDVRTGEVVRSAVFPPPPS